MLIMRKIGRKTFIGAGIAVLAGIAGFFIWRLKKSEGGSAAPSGFVQEHNRPFFRVREARKRIVNYYKRQRLCEQGVLLGANELGKTRVNPAACARLLEDKLSRQPGVKTARVAMFPVFPRIKFICSMRLTQNADKEFLPAAAHRIIEDFANGILGADANRITVSISLVEA
ncbi:MAG: hypothetical protein N3A57_08145, partial [Negativicutes bacterium]|nr:hypothetical protein [Negativicutes bacterium]